MLTEKEKAKRGLLYNANYDKELLRERDHAKGLIYEYNSSHPLDYDKRKSIIRKLFGEIKGDFLIESPFHCDYGYNIFIGENFYANIGCVILDGAKVSIGSNVFLAPYVGLYTAGHPLDVARRNEGLEYARPVTVGDNVWIGAGASVLPGVAIGGDTVIGAGSVVTKDIPSGVLAVGNPCRVIREIGE